METTELIIDGLKFLGLKGCRVRNNVVSYRNASDAGKIMQIFYVLDIKAVNHESTKEIIF